MLTSEDIKKIVQAHEEVFYTKTEMDGKFEELSKDYSKLQTSVTSFATGTKDNADDILVVNQRVTDHEVWIKKAVPKIGVDFKL